MRKNTKPVLDWRGWRQDGCMSDEYRAKMGYTARRQAVRYSEAETRDLLEQYYAGFFMEDIAEYHERTVNGVATQIGRASDEAYWKFRGQVGALWRRDFSRAWLARGPLSVYMRVGYHMIDGKLTRCLDIANAVSKTKGRGHFTRFLDWLENDFMPSTGGTIFVENVINQRLQVYLTRRGYTRDREFLHWYLTVNKHAPD